MRNNKKVQSGPTLRANETLNVFPSSAQPSPAQPNPTQPNPVPLSTTGLLFLTVLCCLSLLFLIPHTCLVLSRESVKMCRRKERI